MAMEIDQESSPHDLAVVLSSKERDFLICRNGEQVKSSSITGKIVGLYLSGSWCGPSYEDLYPKGDFEIVFVSSDKDNELFNEYFGKMPWLANLKQLFRVREIPHLVILDGTGRVLSKEGVKFIKHFGHESYPFTSERVDYLRQEEERAKEIQSLRSLLVYGSRDLISNEEIKISVSELEGKTVCLYFAMSTHRRCKSFTLKLAEVPVSKLMGSNILLYFAASWSLPSREFLPKLVTAYQEIKKKDANFEVIFISSDQDEPSFNNIFSSMPWLALPFDDEKKAFLSRRFNIVGIPVAIAIDPSGCTVNTQVRQLLETRCRSLSIYGRTHKEFAATT
ncbi:hypothetical protein K7X08_006368 [Anisodus acutangulus]|uniref:protein-disulfide reductase n=1 Tax=Anisodus acutangulus TaxID=402998 RepID=A0A9Q1N198_9SOLA|nr:hypothetical protein K7X08_006368 [Anisodus acutangulus]